MPRRELHAFQEVELLALVPEDERKNLGDRSVVVSDPHSVHDSLVERRYMLR